MKVNCDFRLLVRRALARHRRIWPLRFMLFVMTFQMLSGVASAAFNQSAYRFLINLDAANPSGLTSNPSVLDDTIKDSVIDVPNGAFYLVGHTTLNWVIEKRDELHGSGVSAFGTSGQIIEDVASSADEQANAIAIDPSGYIYIAGYDKAQGATNAQWRIEKRHNTNGNLCTAAECVTQFGTNGVVTNNPTGGNDVALGMAIDLAGGYIYVCGYDSTGANQWRIEKRLMSDGSLVTAFGTNGVFTVDPSGQNDQLKNIDIDPTGQYIFVSGFDGSNGNNQWRLEKRSATNSNLCTALECGTLFGTGGVYTVNPSPRDDNITALQVDAAANAIYIAGYDGNGTSNSQEWRIQKLRMDTGALVTAFDTDGIVVSEPGSGDDSVTSMDLDGAGGFLYIIGADAQSGTTNSRWRIEKRNRSDGALVTAFDADGIVNSNPSGNNDPPSTVMIDVNRSFLWAIGGDRTNSPTDMRWRIEQYNLENGGFWLAAQDTKATASSGISFRLRLLIHTDALVVANAQLFKLQVAPKSGTCDTGFVGESGNFTDVGTTGQVRYFDNPTLADATAAVAITGDPSHLSHTNVLETIEEANNFTNPNSIVAGQDGLWDFVMQDSFAFGAYCFKAVTSAGADLATYTVVPEITFCKDIPPTDGLLRHGTYFCEGIKKSFFWVN